MDIRIESPKEYFARPLTKNEIESMRLIQAKWRNYERKGSLGFICVLAAAQLGMMLIDDSWETLGMCFGVSLVAYCWFKSIIPKYLDRMFPCRIFVGGAPVALPCTDDFLDIGFLPPTILTHPFMVKITSEKRRLVKFEYEMLRSLNEAGPFQEKIAS